MRQLQADSNRNKRKRRRKRAVSRIVTLTLVCVLLIGAVQGLYSIVSEKKDNGPGRQEQQPTTNNTQNKTNEKQPSQPKPEPTAPTENTTEPKADTPLDLDKSQWNLLLVNPWTPIPEGFAVERTTLKNGHSIDKRAYPDLQAMMDDARAAGLSPVICSSFRTMDKQQSLFDKQVNKYLARGYSQSEAEEEAAKWVAIPGTSEHQTALAVDIVSLSYQLLDEKQETTAEQKWLMENCYRYGFVLRYPKDKTEVTGIGYEPWHYRYVGKEAAKAIWEQAICLEEYLAQQS